MSEESILLSVSDKIISPLPESYFRTEEVVLPCSEQEKSSPTAVSEPYLAEAKSSFDGAKSIPAAVSESSLAEAKLSFDGIESSPAAVESAAVSEEDLLIRDVDSLVASLAYVARPTEKQRMIARLSTLREQLVKVSALLNRPPSVL